MSATKPPAGVVRKGAGRPPRKGGTNNGISFRVADDELQKARAVAAERGLTVSMLAREALLAKLRRA